VLGACFLGVSVVAVEPFSDQQICMAGIAPMMGRDPKSFKFDNVEEKVYHLHDIRANGRTRWG